MSLDVLYDRYGGIVYHLILGITNDIPAADEMLVSVFHMAESSLAGFSGPSSGRLGSLIRLTRIVLQQAGYATDALTLESLGSLRKPDHVPTGDSMEMRLKYPSAGEFGAAGAVLSLVMIAP